MTQLLCIDLSTQLKYQISFANSVSHIYNLYKIDKLSLDINLKW